MSKNFTTSEVESWRNFEFNGNTFDLSHLNAHSVTYVDVNTNQEYKFFVTYSSHCFTSEIPEKISDQDLQLIYIAKNESRLFDLERYELSKNLPDIVHSLSEQPTLIYYVKNRNYATDKLVSLNGNEITYFVPFTAYRDKKKFRLHIVSAYHNKNIGKKSKVKFFVIANNLLTGKMLPQPPMGRK